MPATALFQAATRWRMTQHALDRMSERGIERHRVIAVLDEPSYTYDHEHDPALRCAGGDGLLIPFNVLTGDVVTVMDTSDQDKETCMSGWINLDARQAEKLLQEWGFEIHSSKNNANLWNHPFDRNVLIPFSAPGRGSRANGKGSFRQAAQVVGVGVNEFLKGPDEEFKTRVAILQKVDHAMDDLNGPDPLGLKSRLADQRAVELRAEAAEYVRTHPAPATTATTATQEATVPKDTYAPVEEKVLAGLLEAHEPVTAKQLAATLGIHYVSAGDGLRKAVRLGDAFVVGKAPRGPGGGQRPDLFWYEKTYTPEPVATAPEPTPTPQETPMRVVSQDTIEYVPTPKADGQKLFTATGTPWPAGGLLIQDEDGVFYVARKLVEEGR